MDNQYGAGTLPEEEAAEAEAPERNEAGDTLVRFDAAFRRFQEALAEEPILAPAILDETPGWVDLLRYKLTPHLAGEGCLIVAVAGGTNSGKSTVFNVLLGRNVSPVQATAAATRRPVLAGSALRAGQCLETKLLPEFKTAPLEEPEALLCSDPDAAQLFVVEDESLPDRLVLMDTPDVDSIARENWEMAEHLHAAGDVLVAVVTGEKYRDDRVIAFFKRARASGRLVTPLMNKANPAKDFAVARRQVEEFRQEIETEAPAFVLAHNFDIENDFDRTIPALDGGNDLSSYLAELDVGAIKHKVYRDSVAHFLAESDAFLDSVEALAEQFRCVRLEIEALMKSAAQTYDPLPGAAVGGMFHEFVQARRGPVRRTIGRASKKLAHGLGAIGRAAGSALRRRARLDARETPAEAELRALHGQAVERIARQFATRCVSLRHGLSGPGGALLGRGLDALDIEASVASVRESAANSGNISEDFRQHAQRTIEKWWNESAARRQALQSLDTILAVMPAAIAFPIAVQTGGLGVSEAVVVAGPLAEQFVARMIEYQFGDAMVGLLAPWQEEQRQVLRRALSEHLSGPMLAPLERAIGVLAGPEMAEMRKEHAACQSQWEK